jgi:uncharacterized protein YhaN
MIIKDIHIDGFGIFHDFSLSSLDKGINIIVGKNEAGKSTLLKFLRFTLFGYPRSVDQRMLPLRGGKHGGRIHGLLATGDEVIFERNGSDKIRLHTQGKDHLDENTWNRFLGHATAGLYSNIYAFTLDELVGLASLEKSGVQDKIFSLGLGLGNISITDIEKKITAATHEIYKTRGSIQQVPLILKEIDESHGRIRQIKGHLSEYRQLVADLEQVTSAAKSAEEELKKLRSEHAVISNYLRCYDSYLGIRRAEEELKHLPPLHELPEKGISLFEKNMESKSELSQRISELKNGTAEERGMDEIEQILEETKVNVPLLENRDQVAYLRNNLENYRQTLVEKADESTGIKELDREITETITGRISSRWTEMDVLEFKDTVTHRSRIDGFSASIEKLRDELRDWQASEKALMSQKSRFNAKAIATLFAVLLMFASFPVFYFSQYIIGAVMVVAGLVLFFGRNAFRKENPLVPVRKKLKELMKEEGELQAAFQNYLQKELRLPAELSIQALPGIFQQIEYIKKQIQQRDRLREKVQDQRLPLIYEFEGKVKALAALLTRKPESTETEILANAVLEEFSHFEELQRQIINLAEELNRKKKEHEQKLSALKTAEQAIRSLLASAGADNEEDFRKKYRENEQIITLQQQQKTAVEKIEAIVGIGKEEEVLKWLSAHEKSWIEERIAELLTSVDEKEQQTAGLHKEKGFKTREKERLAGESDLAEELTTLETRREQLRVAYKQWLTGQLALKVLTGVRSDFEKEKQPAVIKNAGNYFGIITGGEYSGIRSSLEGREMSVFDHRQASKNLDQLSRGTKEQLLVSLRLGFIEEYERQAEPLPVIADEILVNFDPARARQAAKILQEFAAMRQMLIFTCHPATADFFDRDKIKVIDVNGSKS